jgi:hypothetical protein
VIDSLLRRVLPPRILRLALALCSVLAGALGFSVSSASAAQAGWLAPVAISQGGENVGVPRVVLDAQGNATAVWQGWNGEDTVVESAYRPAGGSWQAPIDLSQASGEVTLVAGEHDAGSPRIAVDGHGDTTVVWERYGGTNRIIIEVAYRPAGGSWQAPVNVGEVHTEWDPEPWVAVDERGDTTVVWNDAGVIESAYQPAGGSWGAPVAVSGTDEAFVPQAAVDAQGDATVVWMSYNGSKYVVQSAYRPAGGSWETPTQLSQAGENGGDPDIALDSSGDTMVVWDGHSGENGTTEVVRAAYRPAGGEWQAPADLSAAGARIEGNGLRVALGAHAEAIVTWSNYGGGYDIVQAAYRPVGGAWQAPVNLSENGSNAFPTDLTFDQEGNAVLVWERENEPEWAIQADYRPAGGEWQQPASLGDGDDAVVVLDAPGDSTAADGDATAVWTSGDTIQAAGYDTVEPPQAIEAPATGEAGTPVSVAVPAASPLQVYSPLLSFGDGTSASATSAMHTYAAPGEYTVTFSSTDVLGYKSSTQQTIVIGHRTSTSAPPETGTTGSGSTSPNTPAIEPNTPTTETEATGTTGAASSMAGNGQATAPQAPVPSVPSVVKPIEPKTLTRAQKLAKALNACAKKPKKQRAKCERQVRKDYALKGRERNTISNTALKKGNTPANS